MHIQTHTHAHRTQTLTAAHAGMFRAQCRYQTGSRNCCLYHTAAARDRGPQDPAAACAVGQQSSALLAADEAASSSSGLLPLLALTTLAIKLSA